MTQKTITILGATGFVGLRLTTLLENKGYKIKALTRHKAHHNSLLILSNVDVIETDTHDSTSLEKHFAGSDAVINLVGILNELGSTTHTFDNAHVELTKKVVAACDAAKVPHYLHMSALHADAKNGSSEYLKSKGRGEEVVLANTQLKSHIFCPSVIFGEEDHFFNRFASLLRLLPWFPLACADSKLAPVYIGDVCHAFISVLENPSAHQQKIKLIGPKIYRLKQLVEFTADTIGVRKPIVSLPDKLARLQGRLMGWVPHKPFSVDNYLSLQTDSIGDKSDPKQPTSIEAIVPRYIGSQNKNNVFQSYRQTARR